MRFFYIVILIWTLAVSSKLKWKHLKQSEFAFQVAITLYFSQLFTFAPIIYDICYKRKQYFRFRLEKDESQIFQVHRLVNECLFILGIYLLILCLYESNIDKHKHSWWLSVLVLPIISMETFIYLSMSYELSYIERVMECEFIQEAESGRLSISKFKAFKSFLDKKMDSHFISFSFFSYVIAIGCINLVPVVYYFPQFNIPVFSRILYVYMFEGKDVVFLLLLILKIAALNDKSKSLTLRIVDNYPSPDNTYIYLQQSAKPIVYKIFGLFTVYRTELLLSVFGYAVSFAISLGKGYATAKSL